MPSKAEIIKQAEDACKSALKTVPGQQILRYLIMLGAVYTPYAVKDVASLPVTEEQALAYLEGRRSVALQMMVLSGFTQIGKSE